MKKGWEMGSAGEGKVMSGNHFYKQAGRKWVPRFLPSVTIRPTKRSAAAAAAVQQLTEPRPWKWKPGWGAQEWPLGAAARTQP